MPGIDYHQLRRQIRMRQVLDLIGFRATWWRGPQLRGRCPIPGCCSNSGCSFSVHLTRQVYHCFACRSCGNALDLWAAVHSLSIHQAAVDLCRVANLDPPWLTSFGAISTRCRLPDVPFRAPSRNR
jgi:DNA primase